MDHPHPLILCVLMLLPAVAAAQGAAPVDSGPALASEADRALAQPRIVLRALPLREALPPGLSAKVRAQDVLVYAAPGVAYPARNIGLQCQGSNATLADVPQGLVQVPAVGGAAESRFSEAELAGGRVFRLQVSAGDTLAPGVAPRCELVAYPMPGSALPQGETFWFAFSFWADDWAGTRDEQLIAQWHVQDPRNILLNPFFAMVVRGAELRIELRHNERETPDQASTQLVTAARLAMPVRQWVTAVVQARIANQAAQSPFLRLWLNDQLVADYTGPLGYPLPPGGHAYPKVGIYHWTNGNAWDLQLPWRTLLVGAMLSVRDNSGRYGAAQLADAVAHPGAR